MSTVPVVRIVPCEAHQCPGFEFVEINESDFEPAKHKLFGGAEPDVTQPMTSAQLREALKARGVTFKTNASKPELQALLDAA